MCERALCWQELTPHTHCSLADFLSSSHFAVCSTLSHRHTVKHCAHLHIKTRSSSFALRIHFILRYRSFPLSLSLSLPVGLVLSQITRERETERDDCCAWSNTKPDRHTSPFKFWLKMKTRNCELLTPSLTVLLHTRVSHWHTNWALAVAEVFWVSVLTKSRLWRSLCWTINCLCAGVTSPTTSSVSATVFHLPCGFQTQSLSGARRNRQVFRGKQGCAEPLQLTNKGHLAARSGAETCSPLCYNDKCTLITGSTLLRPN